MQYPGGGEPAGQTREPEGEEVSDEAGSYVAVVGASKVAVVSSRVGTSVLLRDFVDGSAEDEGLSVEGPGLYVAVEGALSVFVAGSDVGTPVFTSDSVDESGAGALETVNKVVTPVGSDV